MTTTATPNTALWERQPQARISLWRVLDLFEAAYRAENRSTHTIAWYRQRLKPFFDYLEGHLEREPALVDLDIPAFRFFILEKQAAGKYQNHPFKKPSAEPPRPGTSMATTAPSAGSRPGSSTKLSYPSTLWRR